jgi:hypothetical protein
VRQAARDALHLRKVCHREHYLWRAMLMQYVSLTLPPLPPFSALSHPSSEIQF